MKVKQSSSHKACTSNTQGNIINPLTNANRILRIFYINIQSLRHKIGEIEVLLDSMNSYDFLCFSEHWMNADEINTVRIHNFHCISSYARTQSKHGGVALFAANTTKYIVRNDINELSVENVCELAAAELYDKNLVIVALYRPPAYSVDCFMNIFESVMKVIDHSQKLIIIGDYNIMFESQDAQFIDFADLYYSYGFFHAIKTPTRNLNCIDNVLTNISESDVSADVVEPYLSDHKGISIGIAIKFEKCKYGKVATYHRPMTEAKLMAFKELYDHYDWADILDTEDPEEGLLSFTLDFRNNIEKTFPLKQRNKERRFASYEPNWYSSNIRNMKETLCFLKDWYKKYPTQSNKQQLAQHRDKYRAEIDRAKRNANDKYVKTSNFNIKAIWDVVDYYRKRKSAEEETHFSAEEYNMHLVTSARRLTGNVHIDGIFNNSEITSHVPFFFKTVTREDIKKTIKNIVSKPTKDIYGINTHMLHSVSDQLIAPLTHLINKCIALSIFPKAFKHSVVIPIYKKGKKEDCNNYRPIAIIPTFSKILEGILNDQLITYFEQNNLFSESQFGFRSGRSTTDAILELTSYINEGFEGKSYVGANFYDLTKAFDCVNHNNLLRVMKRYGFTATASQMMESYLSERTQSVRMGGDISEPLTIDIGIPQGSNLGPTLFIIYINQIPQLMHNKCIIYADDTTTLHRAENIEYLKLALQEAKTNTDELVKSFGLVLNQAKSTSMIYSLRHIDDTNYIKPTKFLGIVMDEKLIWNQHVNELCSKLNSNTFLFRNLAKVTSQNICMTAYHAIFISHICYGLIVWGHSAHLSRVFKLQRRVLRIILKKGYRDDVRDDFIKMGILTVPSLYMFHCIKYVRFHIAEYVRVNAMHDHGTRSGGCLRVNYTRIQKTRTGVNYYGPIYYNGLPDNIKSETSNKSFLKLLKLHLIEKAYYSISDCL